MAQIKAQQEFLYAQTAVDQVDLERALAQDAVAILQLLRRDNLHGVAFFAEEIAEELVFALAGMVGGAKFHDGDVGLLGGPAELPVGFEQRLQKVLAAASAREGVFLAEFLDGGRFVEQIRQSVRIAGAGGRIGIVLDEMHVPVDQVGVEPRGHFERLVAGIDGSQHFLGGKQIQARQQNGIDHHHSNTQL